MSALLLAVVSCPILVVLEPTVVVRLLILLVKAVSLEVRVDKLLVTEALLVS